MIIMGGTFPNSSYLDCDAKQIYGQHNLNLGQEDVQEAEWYQFLPNLTTSYQVPTTINSVISGSATGGASLTTPTQGWGHQDLPVYFTRHAPSTSRTATRYIPPTSTQNTTTPTHTPSTSHKTNVGAIAGGTVGGVLAIILVSLIAYLCLRRHKQTQHRLSSSQPHELTNGIGNGRPRTPMGELDTSQPWSPQTTYSSQHKDSPTTASSPYPPYSPQRSPDPNLPHLPPLPFASQEHGWQHLQQQQQKPLQYFPPPPQAQPYFPPPPLSATTTGQVPWEQSQHSQSHEMPNIRSPANVYERGDKRPRLEPVVSREDIGVEGRGEGGRGDGGRGRGESPAVSVAED